MKLPEFKSILCLNGRLPNQDFFKRHKSLPIVCADGASNSILALSILPDYIIGDLDSVILSNIPESCKVLKRQDQNKTDFEKSLIELERMQLLPCLVLGISGGEIDHALYNLNCFMKHSRRYNNIFYDVDENNIGKWGIALNGKSVKIDSDIGKKVSILPYSEIELTTSGLAWDLDCEKLCLQSKASIRNEMQEKYAILKPHSGMAVVIVEE
jgi:thiamine pyrophosphokinase